MDNSPFKLRSQKIGRKTVEALEKRNFEAYYCDDCEEALQKVISLIPDQDIISFGGSKTLEEIGLLDLLRRGGYKLIDRDTAKNSEERLDLMRRALLCDTYITGTNAVSEDGQLVNIDGNGNRVAAMTFGPKNVLVVVGVNKIVKTLEDAYSRARNIAAPINVQRFDKTKTPCYVNGACQDCTGDECICAYIINTRVCRPPKKIKVIIVGENLGF